MQPLGKAVTAKQVKVIVGQYQLPLFEGEPPHELFTNKQIATEVISQHQKQGKCLNLGFAQLITRCSSIESQAGYANNWWPNAATSMIFLQHHLPREVYRYIMHARHGKYEEPVMTLQEAMGENFESNLDKVKQVFM